MNKKLDYTQYIDRIINIFCLSSKENSVLFDLKIENYKAKMKLSIITQMGEKEEFSDVVLDCENSFYTDFLIPLVQKLNQVISIQKKDIIYLPENSLTTFRMISENNDLFSIDGLSSDNSKSLMSLLEKNQGKEQVLFSSE